MVLYRAPITKYICLLICAASCSAALSSNGYKPLERPAYPLYAIVSGNIPTEQNDIDQLARHFVLAQLTASKADIDRLHAVNPHFKALCYMNGTYTRPNDDLRLAESEYRHDFAMFLAGVLASDISASDRQIKIVNDGKPVLLRPSTVQGDYSSVDPQQPSTKYYVTWIRVDNEFMRLDASNSEPGVFTISRGFASTKPAAHKAGARVFCPIYVGADEESGNYPGSLKDDVLRYALDPASEHGWTWQANKAIRHIKEGYDGVWLDIVSTVFFNMSDMYGRHVQPWNFKAGRVYTPDEYRLAHEKKINYIQESVRKAVGHYPCLVANNFRGVNYSEGEGGESLLLKPTKVKPRPLDGYCMENTIGGYGNGISIHEEYKWHQKMIALARATQDGIAAYPIIGPAGVRSLLLEDDTPERDRFERFGYASYLLTVEKNGKTAFGIPAAYRAPDGKGGYRRFIKLNKQYFYPIGDPTESRKWTDFDGYRLPGTHTYVRRFTNGIVAVNPSNADDPKVDLDTSYLDPVTGAIVRTIAMKSQTGKILLSITGR